MKFEDIGQAEVKIETIEETAYYKDLLKRLLESNSPHTGTGQRSTFSCFGCKKYPHRTLVGCQCICHTIRKIIK